MIDILDYILDTSLASCWDGRIPIWLVYLNGDWYNVYWSCFMLRWKDTWMIFLLKWWLIYLIIYMILLLILVGMEVYLDDLFTWITIDIMDTARASCCDLMEGYFDDLFTWMMIDLLDYILDSTLASCWDGRIPIWFFYLNGDWYSGTYSWFNIGMEGYLCDLFTWMMIDILDYILDTTLASY
jgi:hypothetical protein